MDVSTLCKKYNLELLLHQAVKKKNLEELRELIKGGTSVFKLDSNNNCALAIALANNAENCVQELLSHYEHALLLLDKNYDCPIYAALNDKDVDLISTWCAVDNIGTPVKIYIQNGAKGVSAIKDFYITNIDHLRIVNELYKNGLVDLNIKNKEDNSLLDIAVLVGNVDNVKSLLKLKVKNCINSENRLSAFKKSIEKASLNIIKEFLLYDLFIELNNDENIEMLHVAATRGDIDIFNFILELLVKDKNQLRKMLEHQSVKDHTTILQKLTLSNCFELVIDLLKYKPNLDILVNDNRTHRDSLLNIAISENSLQLVRRLIAEGANVLKFPNEDNNIRDVTNALINAACYGTPDIFKEIVTACPSEIFKNGAYGSDQALLDCIENLPIDCVKLLLDLGINTDINLFSHTCLSQAVWSNNVEKIKFIVELLKLDSQTGKCKFLDKQNGFGDYILTIHVKNQLDVFKYLLNLGVNLNLINRKGMSPLHYACLCGNYEIVKLLLLNNANTEQINDKGNKPIQSAAKSNSLETFKLLFNSETNLEMRNFKGNTLLMIATKSNSYFICKELINAGADVNAVNYNNDTALHFAKELEIINILTQNGANKMAVNNERHTPYLSMAVQIEDDMETKHYTTNREISIKNHLQFDIDYSVVNYENQNLLHFILQDVDNCFEAYQEIFKEKKFESLFEYTGYDYLGRNIFLLACNVKNAPIKIFEKIFKFSNPDLNCKSNNGTCAIQLLITRDNIPALEYILKKGANIDILTNINNETPLILAASKNTEIVELLLKYGADASRQDALGGTALHKAVKNNRIDIAMILVAAGTDLGIKDFNNKTALDYDENGFMKAVFKPFYCT